MPANHESTLYLVEIASRKTGRVTFEVFRTRATARKRANAVNVGEVLRRVHGPAPHLACSQDRVCCHVPNSYKNSATSF